MFGRKTTDRLIELYNTGNEEIRLENVVINKTVTVNAKHATEGTENINYLQAIKRVIGISDKPLANE